MVVLKMILFNMCVFFCFVSGWHGSLQDPEQVLECRDLPADQTVAEQLRTGEISNGEGEGATLSVG